MSQVATNFVIRQGVSPVFMNGKVQIVQRWGWKCSLKARQDRDGARADMRSVSRD